MCWLRNLLDRIARRWGRHYLTRRDAMFGEASVYDTHWSHTPIRLLDLNGTYQSATYLDDRWDRPPFPYLSRFDCIYEAERPMRELCLLGGGGYAYPKHVIAHHPESSVDVVEVDPVMTQLAWDYFFLDRLEATYHPIRDGRMTLVCSDAMDHLRACADRGRRYDAILNDCFAAEHTVEELEGGDGAHLIARCLHPGGMYVVNIVSAVEGELAGPLVRQVAALSDVFRHIQALPCQDAPLDRKNNILLIASDKGTPVEGAIELFSSL